VRCTLAATFDVVFALDDSSNIQADEWTAMLNLIDGYVDQFTVGPGNVRIAVVRYSNTAEIVFDLNEYRYHHVAARQARFLVGSVAVFGEGISYQPTKSIFSLALWLST